MQDELPDDQTVGNDNAAAATGGVTPVREDPAPGTVQTGGDQIHPELDDSDDNDRVKESPPGTGAGQGENQVQQILQESPAANLNSLTGNNSKLYNKSEVHYHHVDAAKNLAQFVTENPLQPSKRSYQSVSNSDIAGYAGVLLARRILLLSCYNEDVALNVAKSIANESKAISKRLVTIESNCQGAYTLRNLIEELAHRKGNDGLRGEYSSQSIPTTICVWAAHDISEGDVSNAILDSLFIGNAQIEQYQAALKARGLYLICLVSSQKLQDYNRSKVKVNLKNWDIDFLRPLLEEHGSEELAETITEQRRQGKWDADDAGFYKEIGRHLSAGKLREIVAGKTREDKYVDLGIEQLFDRQDPLVDTTLYCATFYPDLSPEDFSQLIQLFLEDAVKDVSKSAAEDAAEDVSKSADQSRNGSKVADATKSPTLTQRWRHEADAILRRCELAVIRDADSKHVVNFKVDGLRNRLSKYIRNDHYFFYESKFKGMRQQGLIFSPNKKIAEGARQLLVELATLYAPDRVANWLYEIVYEFEQAAQTAYLYREGSQLFHLIPDARVKAARHYVCRGLSLVLSRLNKEPDLQEAARLFWQKLLQYEHQWFLDLLRQMGNSVPAETLRWLKQVLEQGRKDIRAQAHGYLLGYLLRRDSLIYTTLKELMEWSPDGQAGRAMRTLLIIYCVETNRQLPQQDYGKWPSSHPLFGFQDRAEARERLELLIGWVFTAAFEVDADGGLSIIADIIAGWYFIFSPPLQTDPGGGASAQNDADELNARAVRQLLLECLARYCSRTQKNSLLATWEDFRNNILEEVGRFEEFTGQLIDIALDAKLMTDVAAARRKLLDTRALLSRLRKDFMSCEA